MANISSSFSFGYSSTTDSFSSSASNNLTQTGTGALLEFQTIGTTSETLVLGDLANVGGGLFLKNTDSTNYVEIDSASTFDKFPQKILAGRAIFLASQTLTIYAKANTASVVLAISAAAL
jgi:hypothetical protein